MNQEGLIKTWERFEQGKDFMLNPDRAHVKGVADGVLANIEKYGSRFCPCRLRDGTKERDLELVCPCNFKTQDAWTKQERCWCGLFVKRK